ncbi:hypothetical protein CPS_2354 [Colwellia psychrerythraea 34H]|uniref:Uncharacterized protein n=1 Tax=Colwellia psychrerythraea (strain 34H / ATCC BAA-681) TaxID=167879 RepID=Q482E6_COLP3|nr:hypothetical protein CPS_2354 [Colwellia psychrerythraea 34H]
MSYLSVTLDTFQPKNEKGPPYGSPLKCGGEIEI